METTNVFSPETADLTGNITICGALLLGCILAGWRLSRGGGGDPRRRIILPMLFYFGGLLSLMALGGNWLKLNKFPVLEVAAAGITVDGTEYPLPSRGDIRIENVKGSDNKTIQLMLLQLPSGKTLAFPSNRYPVPEIMRVLRP